MSEPALVPVTGRCTGKTGRLRSLRSFQPKHAWAEIPCLLESQLAQGQDGYSILSPGSA